MEIKIMTFNVLNGWNTSNIGERDDIASNKILSLDPDVVGFQEMDDCYRLAQVPLSELISEKYAEAGKAHVTWNPIFYKKDKFICIVFGEEEFEKGTSYDYPKGGRSRFRTVCYAVLEDKASKARFILLNLHYDYNGKSAELTAENQEDESGQVISLAKSLLERYEADALFVTGDYNCRIGGVACVKMLEGGFVDTHALAEEKDDRGSCARLGDPLWGYYENAAIDHVFYMGKKELRVTKYQTVEDIRAASDHAPVLVTVEIN